MDGNGFVVARREHIAGLLAEFHAMASEVEDALRGSTVWDEPERAEKLAALSALINLADRCCAAADGVKDVPLDVASYFQRYVTRFPL